MTALMFALTGSFLALMIFDIYVLPHVMSWIMD